MVDSKTVQQFMPDALKVGCWEKNLWRTCHASSQKLWQKGCDSWQTTVCPGK
jgi:hypothetical protein